MSSNRNVSSFRRSSLTPSRPEKSAEAKNGNYLNRSDSAIDVRTPVQNRLRRLQTSLREEQLKKSQEKVPQSSVADRLVNNNTKSGTPPSKTSRAKSPPTPMVMSPPKRQHLKRRSDQNHNDLAEAQTLAKRTRVDKSPSPSRNRRVSASRSNLSSSRLSLPGPPEYENDIEMTDATIQEEVNIPLLSQFPFSSSSSLPDLVPP